MRLAYVSSVRFNMDSVEVLVVGGGPAGTTAACLLAAKGHGVMLFEKDTHPRFHIGVSLLPCNLPILERLGVLAQVADIGVHKPGADFTCEDGLVQSFPFARALGATPEYAFQVRRAEFDQILFENCRKRGVDVRERHQVLGYSREEDGFAVSYRDDGDVVRTLKAGFVIDASGRDSLFARLNGWRKKSPKHASAAVFGHFRNVELRTGPLSGNISIYWFAQGWIWMIPLRDGVMSVGAVCWPDYLRAREVDLETFLRQTVLQVPDASRRMQDAVSVGPVSATGNYSYRAKELCGQGYLLVGDAYAFIDPVLSSGVYLAMNSAVECVPAVEAWLGGDEVAYQRACRAYRRMIDGKIRAFSWFIYRFTTPTMRDLFRNPRND